MILSAYLGLSCACAAISRQANAAHRAFCTASLPLAAQRTCSQRRTARLAAQVGDQPLGSLNFDFASGVISRQRRSDCEAIVSAAGNASRPR